MNNYLKWLLTDLPFNLTFNIHLIYEVLVLLNDVKMPILTF